MKRSLVATFLVALAWSSPVFGQETPDDVDHLSVAARLVADGHIDRARAVMRDVEQPTDTARLADFHTVRGIIALDEGAYRDAITQLDAAIFAGRMEDVMFVYLAQAYYQLNDYETAVRMIRNADEAGAGSRALQIVRVRSLWQLGRLHDAWRALHHNIIAFPDEPQFVRLLVFLLVELNLFQQVSELAKTFFESEDHVVADDYLAFGQSLLRSGQTDVAAQFLEHARLLFPDNSRLALQHARTLSAGGLHVAAGELLQRVAGADDQLLAEAAEAFRKGGAADRALYMNAQITDQRAKLRQRVGILTDREDYEAVVALEERLGRLGLLDDQQVLYGVAYAAFQIGDYEMTERLLDDIEDPALFESATRLRQIIAFCAVNSC